MIKGRVEGQPSMAKLEATDARDGFPLLFYFIFLF
jgi:hypothetical protein